MYNLIIYAFEVLCNVEALGRHVNHGYAFGDSELKFLINAKIFCITVARYRRICATDRSVDGATIGSMALRSRDGFSAIGRRTHSTERSALSTSLTVGCLFNVARKNNAYLNFAYGV